jgi:hypothetical protein
MQAESVSREKAEGSGGLMTFDEYRSWESHEERNGADQGKWDALRGSPSLTEADMPKSMPIKLADKTSRWADLVATRWEWYQLGYASVTKFSMDSFSKKEADQQADSLKRNGYSVIRVERQPSLNTFSKYRFVVLAATEKRGELPYRAKKL